MENEKLVKWICAFENGEDEEKLWLEIGERHRSILKPLRDEFIRDRQYISKMQAQLDDISAKMNFYKEALRKLPNPIFMKDDKTRFFFFNKKYEEVFGIESESFIGKTVCDLEYLPKEDREKYQEEDAKMIQESSVVHYEVPFVFSDGKVHESLYWSKGFSVPGTGEKGLVGEIVDISVEKKLERNLKASVAKLTEAKKKMEENSRTDTLTGLANRYVLEDSIPTMISMSNRHNVPLSILLADLDRFKFINDTYGHLVGDEVLKKFAMLLKKNYRSCDIPIRYGGEEFLIFLPMTDLEKAKAIAERTSELLRKEVILPDKKNTTVSIGVTEYRNGEDIEDLLRRADQALYIAKNKGRDRIAVL